MANGNPLQAHHIIPWGKSGHPVIQKAAQSQQAFHMNEALNGIPLSNTLHNGSHSNYDNLVLVRLNAIMQSNPTPDQAYAAVMELIDDIRSAIQNSPGVHINQIDF